MRWPSCTRLWLTDVSCHLLIFQFSWSVTLTNQASSFLQWPERRVRYTEDQLCHGNDTNVMIWLLPTHKHRHTHFSLADCGVAEQKHSEGHSELLWWLGLQEHHGLCAEEGTVVLLSSCVCVVNALSLERESAHPLKCCPNSADLSLSAGGVHTHTHTRSTQLTDHAQERVICLLNDASRRSSAFRCDVLNVVPGCGIFVL